MTHGWSDAGSHPGRSMPCGVLVDDRVAFFASGIGGPTEWSLYDPSANTFAEIAPLPWLNGYPYCVGTAEGWIAVVGGNPHRDQQDEP